MVLDFDLIAKVRNTEKLRVFSMRTASIGEGQTTERSKFGSDWRR